MSQNSIKIFDNNIIIEKKYNKYKIKLTSIFDLINIHIQIEDALYYYVSDFTIKYLLKYTLLTSCISPKEIIEFINSLIEQNNIQIKEDDTNLKLILISSDSKCQNVELNLSKKDLSPNEIIEYLKKENRDLRDMISKLNEEKNELEEKNKQLEAIYNMKIKSNSLNLKNNNSFQPHNDRINSISSFPSFGNIISVSNDRSINIYDIDMNIIQTIPNAHDGGINYVEIKDENNFITCSNDKNIKLWIKNNNQYEINKSIIKAHDERINKVIYFSNGNLISCSHDEKIKIWEEINNNYNPLKILSSKGYIYSLLLLEDKNILISSGEYGTIFWNLEKYNNICNFEQTICVWNEGICKLDEDKIIVSDKGTFLLKIISISKKEIIKTINHPFQCFGIIFIKKKNIFLVGGESKDIRIYRNDNYECIQKIQNAHEDNINGFFELEDGFILSFSWDKTIKLWYF